jgi:hypothetical protein
MPTTLERPIARTKKNQEESISKQRVKRVAHPERTLPTPEGRVPQSQATKISVRRSVDLLPRQVAVESRATQRRRRTALDRFFEGFGLEKFFTLFSFLTAATLLAFCALDLALAWPWMRISPLFDGTFLICAMILLWLSFDVFRDQAGGGPRNTSF